MAAQSGLRSETGSAGRQRCALHLYAACVDSLSWGTVPLLLRKCFTDNLLGF